jgi:hypothetical protein
MNAFKLRRFHALVILQGVVALLRAGGGTELSRGRTVIEAA